ncbi:hypothetical protein SMC28_003851, partial [Cronobacter turicensis]|nr:hypothetical protein [Cronobacter turicensis]
RHGASFISEPEGCENPVNALVHIQAFVTKRKTENPSALGIIIPRVIVKSLYTKALWQSCGGLMRETHRLMRLLRLLRGYFCSSLQKEAQPQASTTTGDINAFRYLTCKHPFPGWRYPARHVR